MTDVQGEIIIISFIATTEAYELISHLFDL